MVKIKVCGMTQNRNMLQIAALKPDYLGFIFYKPSARDVSDKINHLSLDQLPASILKVAVMVDQSMERAMEIITRYNFDMVQLHGSESPAYCEKIQKTLPVIKAFAVKDSLPDNLIDYEDSCSYFLFDTKADKPGGTGVSFDHSVLVDYTLKTPFFLSGGIGPDFKPDNPVLSHSQLHAMDINSRFETKPGLKNVEWTGEFIKKVVGQKD
jgi:phosphoribosylanthranilate isomerase